MNRLLVLLTLATVLFSCGGNDEKTGQPEATTNPDSSSTFLPIADFLRYDIQQVDSFATGILRKATINGRKDSSFIQLPEFHRLAEQFLLKELETGYFKANFEETSMMDESTRMLNFLYTPTNPESSVREAIVFVSPSLGADRPDRIYFETVATQGDTTVEKKYTWKLRKYCYILTIKQPKSGEPITTMEKLIWDPQHFAD